MTAPVVQQPSEPQPTDTGRSFTVSFVLPAGMTAETAPRPADDRVSLRTVPPALSAAVRYSGRWSASAYERHRDRLLAAVEAAGLHPVGQPRWLRFDPPFTPWFLRHNEVVVDVAEPTQPLRPPVSTGGAHPPYFRGGRRHPQPARTRRP
jgi:hypothetical protein